MARIGAKDCWAMAMRDGTARASESIVTACRQFRPCDGGEGALSPVLNEIRLGKEDKANQ